MNYKKLLKILIYIILIPLIIVVGIILFKDRKYNFISIIILILALIPPFLNFEKKDSKTKELIIIAVMSALSVLGRIIFAPIPAFKPITAIVIITAIAFGSEAGFLTGAISALASNFIFGQGPWTPFQMFCWGMIGLITGLIFRNLKKEKINYILLVIIGLISGVFYSLLIDVWTTISFDGVFNIKRYLLYISSSIPFMVTYAVSNVIFLVILTKPILQKCNRIKIKYELFTNKENINEK